MRVMPPLNEEDLVRMNQVLRHRLRNLASGIKSAVSYLGRELEGRLQPDEREYFPLILHECDALSELTGRLGLAFDAPPIGHPVQARDIKLRLASYFQQRFPHAELRQEADGEAWSRVVSSDQSLLIPLQEIVTNAAEAAPDRPVRVQWSGTARELLCRVEDDGEGVDEQRKARLFQPFFTTKGRHLGLGLYIARRLLEQAAGGITVECRPAGGVGVDIRIPVSR
jgi:signal transduction histidine kinase